MFKKKTKTEYLKIIKNNLLVFLGSVILAFGTAIFLTRLNIVAGGVSGIGIIVQSFCGATQVVDIVVAIASWLLFFIGLLVLGKDFAIKTLNATIVYPIALSLFLRVPAFGTIADAVTGTILDEAGNVIVNPDYYVGGIKATYSIGNVILCALFGGVFTGAGVGLSFLGGGSTGGTDILIFIICKYTKAKESIISFLSDGIIIVLSMFLIKDNIVPSLCGIFSAFICALLIDYIYIGFRTSYQVDIISSKWEEIKLFVQDKLDRGSTIIHAKGGYQGAERIILRVVFDKRQYARLRDYISRIDPNAFITFTATNAVYGEGFKNNDVPEAAVKKLAKKKK